MFKQEQLGTNLAKTMLNLLQNPDIDAIQRRENFLNNTSQLSSFSDDGTVTISISDSEIKIDKIIAAINSICYQVLVDSASTSPNTGSYGSFVQIPNQWHNINQIEQTNTQYHCNDFVISVA